MLHCILLLSCVLNVKPGNSFVVSQIQSLQTAWKFSQLSVDSRQPCASLSVLKFHKSTLGPRTRAIERGLLHNSPDCLRSDSRETTDDELGETRTRYSGISGE